MNGNGHARPPSFAPTGRIRSLIYRSLGHGSAIFQKASIALNHAAAGLLRREDLRASSKELWSGFSVDNEQVDAGLEDWERRMYRDLLKPSDRILLVGCGSGRDLIALRQLGYEVTGLDPAHGIADRARAHLARRGLRARVIEGFIEDDPLDELYDVAVFSGSAYSCVQGADVRVATLANLQRHLAPGGRIAITYSRVTNPPRRAVRLTHACSSLFAADWRPEPGDSFTRAPLSPGVLGYLHLFGPGEVSRECARAGLRVVQDQDESAMPWIVAVGADVTSNASRSERTASQTAGSRESVRG